MTISKTEHDHMMDDIMAFTTAIVGIAELRNVAVADRANAIYMAENVFHKILMDKMIKKCESKAIPSTN